MECYRDQINLILDANIVIGTDVVIPCMRFDDRYIKFIVRNSCDRLTKHKLTPLDVAERKLINRSCSAVVLQNY